MKCKKLSCVFSYAAALGTTSLGMHSCMRNDEQHDSSSSSAWQYSMLRNPDSSLNHARADFDYDNDGNLEAMIVSTDFKGETQDFREAIISYAPKPELTLADKITGYSLQGLIFPGTNQKEIEEMYASGISKNIVFKILSEKELELLSERGVLALYDAN